MNRERLGWSLKYTSENTWELGTSARAMAWLEHDPIIPREQDG
ncbi:unnamed protein product [Periconia digitata]|uniref:Uncharacterized protein n=1 Tax=Periconia digitata TaxID=1303443 RepID=A0A9W4UDG6_9PLEO|nr:unnamed protein product [Periconia digitata]